MTQLNNIIMYDNARGSHDNVGQVCNDDDSGGL